MAAQQKERSAKTAARRKARGEEEIRLHCMAGTRQALAELMVWSGIEEHGEAITLMIHRLHELSREEADATAPQNRVNRKCGAKAGSVPYRPRTAHAEPDAWR